MNKNQYNRRMIMFYCNITLYFHVILLLLCYETFGFSLIHSKARNYNRNFIHLINLPSSFPLFNRLEPTLEVSSIPNSSSSNNDSKRRRNILSQFLKIGINFILSSSMIFSNADANAIGNLYELQNQHLILQDISFRVNNIESESKFLKAVFQDTCKLLRSSSSTRVFGFGPDTLNKPPNFYPGVSSLLENGGHATITLEYTSQNSKNNENNNNNDGVTEYYERGNGLQYIKFGTEVLRLSKGIEAGMNLRYAYGWIDGDSPNGIPVEIVVGTSRDPLMAVALQVRDMKQSLQFFTEDLGMKKLSFPLARQPKSIFEPQQPEGSVYVAYSENSMGIILLPLSPSSSKSSSDLVIGNQLNVMTIIYDDNDKKNEMKDFLPRTVIDTIMKSKPNDAILTSPDGYRFQLIPLSTFSKQSTNILSSSL